MEQIWSRGPDSDLSGLFLMCGDVRRRRAVRLSLSPELHICWIYEVRPSKSWLVQKYDLLLSFETSTWIDVTGAFWICKSQWMYGAVLGSKVLLCSAIFDRYYINYGFGICETINKHVAHLISSLLVRRLTDSLSKDDLSKLCFAGLASLWQSTRCNNSQVLSLAHASRPKLPAVVRMRALET